jgi:hypothetical protein
MWCRRFARLLAAFNVALLLFFGLDAALFLRVQLGVASSAAIASRILASRFSLSLAQFGISSARLSLPKISFSWTSAAWAAENMQAALAFNSPRPPH